MANRWIDYVYKETDYRRGDAAVALKLADAANNQTDKCTLKIETIAAQTRLSSRQVKRILHDLERDGFIRVERFRGRGKVAEYTLQKVTSMSPFSDRKKVTSATVKGDIESTKKVTFEAEKPMHIREPLEEPSKTEEGEQQPTPAAAFGPPRNLHNVKKKHPAIVAIWQLTKIQPDAILLDDLIDVLGDAPDIPKLTACYKAWRHKGFNPKNYDWISDWYVNGIPEKQNGTGKKSNGNGYHKRTDADVIQESADFYEQYPS